MANNPTGYQAGYRPPQPVPPRRANAPTPTEMARRAAADPRAAMPRRAASSASSGAPRPTATGSRAAVSNQPRRVSASQPPRTGANTRASQPPRTGASTRAKQPPRTNPSRARKRRRPPYITFLLVLLLTVVLVLGAYTAKMMLDVNAQGDNVFYQGVYVGAVHLGGLTQEQALQALQATEQQMLSGWTVTLQFPSDTKQIHAGDIDLRLNLADQLEGAWNVGRSGNLIERQRIINGLKAQPYYASGGVEYDVNKLYAILQAMQQGITRAPVNAGATFTPDQESPFTFTDEVYGRQLDTEPLFEQIHQYASSLQSGVITPQLEEIKPELTKAEMQQNLTCIVSVPTDISYKSEPGRNENIRIACEYLNGLTVLPNEKVSTNKIFKKRLEKNGYQSAPEIAYGEYVPGIGGGVCQVSTTLYQALLRSGLKIEQRYAHALPSNYAQKGQDATVSDNGADLVFRNNTKFPIYIRARMVKTSDKNKPYRCEVSIYGRSLPEGIKYTLESIVTEEIPIPEPVQKMDKKHEHNTYYAGETFLEEGRMGYKVDTYLVTMKDGMVQDRQLDHSDYYKEKTPILWLGTAEEVVY